MGWRGGGELVWEERGWKIFRRVRQEEGKGEEGRRDRREGAEGVCIVEYGKMWERGSPGNKLIRAVQAKVVLVERDIDKWYPSFADTVVGQSFMFSSDIIIYVVEPLLGMRLGHMVRRLLLGYFNASTEKEILANMKTVYRRHYDEIRATMPKDRLLEMDLKDGWGPLCAFLGKEVPNESFPHVNEVQELKNKVWEKQKELFWQTGNFLATWILPVAVAGTAGHWYTRR